MSPLTPSRKQNNYNNEKGVILVTAILFAFVIAILSTTLYAYSISGRKEIQFETNRLIAFHMSESGVDDAITQLASNPNYSGTPTPVSLGGGMYAITVTTPDSTNNPNVRKIVSTGYAPDNAPSSYAYQSRTITTYVNMNPKATFTQAVFSVNKIRLQNSAKIDSYNSNLGDYGDNNIGAKGHIVSNTTAAGNISLSDSTKLSGNAVCGPGGTPNNVISVTQSAVITGTRTAAQTATTYDSVTVPDNLTNRGSLYISGETTTQLAAGTYWYSSISISNSGRLKLLGPVTIYVTGNVSIQGKGISTYNKLPANFTLNVAGDRSISVNTSQDLYGVIYAPESGKNNNGVRLSGSSTDVYGAVISYEYKASDSAKLHYDEALTSQGGGGSNQMAVVSWQES
ncbi:MAG: hypothetical protein HZC17_06995 [Candidatus Omnitrophica bacterium]|nr:hypothetical protein [Candidatus Omnitrophota bacterium]